MKVQTHWVIFSTAFRRQLTYRAATLAGLFTNFFFGLLRAALMTALYAENIVVAGYSLDAAITFTGLSQAFIGFLSIFYWWDVMLSINSGEVSSDLLKPISYFRYWMLVDLGRALAALLTRGFPIILAYYFFVGFIFPADWYVWPFLLVSMILAWFLSFCFRFLVNLTAFWSTNSRGIMRFAFFLSWFFSGFLMPLRFFPDAVVRIMNMTPFPHMVNSIFEIYLGNHSIFGMIEILAWQAGWCIMLAVLVQFVLQAGLRRLVIQGG